MRIVFRENVEVAKEKSFARWDIKKSIYELCYGERTVDEIGGRLGKSREHVRVYLLTLEEEGIVVRKGNTYEAVV